MQAIILAAGMGRRLGELTRNNTKCMIKVNGLTLIDRLLTQLSALNLSKVVIVTGYKGENLRNYIGNRYDALNIEYIENSVYSKTNNIYSLWLAKERLESDDTLLIESDLIFEDSLFHKIIDNPYPNLALVDKYETWMDGTMVRLDEDNNIVNFISKKAFNYSDVEYYYKTVNIYKFSKEFSKTHYVPFLDAYIKALGNNEYYEQVLRVITLIDVCELKALPLQGEKWYEIDDVQDLNIAETLFAEPDKKLKCYQKRFGGYWRFPSLVDFCYLVNPYFPSRRMKEEMKANFNNLLTQYPSGMGINSMLISKYFNIRPEYACAGNGAAELIKSLIESIEGNTGVIFPTFEEYPNRSEKQRIIEFVPDNPDFTYTADELIGFYDNKHISALILINPDNPSGNYLQKSDVLKIAKWAKKKNICFVVDESFIDFADNGLQSTLLDNTILETYPNMMVVKSISKSYGVPGLRLGIIASADRARIESFKKDVSIWNINSFAEFYLQIYGKYENDYIRACDKFLAERTRFLNKLKDIGFLRVIPSQANYFLCEVTDRFTSQELATVLLNKYNILIKDCGTKKGFAGRNYIRIAIRDTRDNDMLLNALNNI